MISRNTLILVLLCIGTGQLLAQSKIRKTYHIQRMNEYSIVYIDGKPGEPYLSEYELYNDDGQWVERVDVLTDGSIKFRETRKLKGDIILEESIDQPADRNPRERPAEYERKVYKYKKDQKISTEIFDRDGKLLESTSYSYTSFGDVSEKLTTYTNGNASLKELYTYDDRGLKIEKRIFVGEVLVESKKYTYE